MLPELLAQLPAHHCGLVARVFAGVVHELPLVVLRAFAVDLDALGLELARDACDAAADLRSAHPALHPCLGARGRQDLVNDLGDGRRSGRNRTAPGRDGTAPADPRLAKRPGYVGLRIDLALLLLRIRLRLLLLIEGVRLVLPRDWPFDGLRQRRWIRHRLTGLELRLTRRELRRLARHDHRSLRVHGLHRLPRNSGARPHRDHARRNSAGLTRLTGLERLELSGLNLADRLTNRLADWLANRLTEARLGLRKPLARLARRKTLARLHLELGLALLKRHAWRVRSSFGLLLLIRVLRRLLRLRRIGESGRRLNRLAPRLIALRLNGLARRICGARHVARTASHIARRGRHRRVGVRRSGSGVVLQWDGAGVLQSSTNVAGGFGDIDGATSPHTNSIVGDAQRFFRLRN